MSYILGGVEEKPIGDSEDLEAIAGEVEAGHGPVALVRPGHRPVVLVSAEEWQRLDELESAESRHGGGVMLLNDAMPQARALTRASTSRALTRRSSGADSLTCSVVPEPRDRCWLAPAP